MKKDFIALGHLTKRGVKNFLKDKGSVFFSVLAPLIVFLLYVLFLGDAQVSALKGSLTGLNVSESTIKATIDGWMLAGTIAIACITVSFSAQNIMIQDRENGTRQDLLTTPTKRWVINFSYLSITLLVTLAICLILLFVCFVYIIISGGHLTFVSVLGSIGMLLLSVISSSLISTLLCGFIKTNSAHGAAAGILSAAIGFICGAYMPISVFPKFIQYLVLFVPGTYSAGIFRNLFMAGGLDEISAINPEFASSIRRDFSMDIDFFGTEIGTKEMLIIFAFTIVLFAVIMIIKSLIRKKIKTNNIKVKE